MEHLGKQSPEILDSFMEHLRALKGYLAWPLPLDVGEQADKAAHMDAYMSIGLCMDLTPAVMARTLYRFEFVRTGE